MQNAAFILIGIGVLAVIGWVFQSFFTDSQIPLLLRIAVGAIGAGILLLLGIALKDRINGSKKDGFKEVDK